MGLKTLFGLRKQGFFIPYRYAHTLPGPGERPAYEPIATLMAAREDGFAAVLEMIEGHGNALCAIGDAPPPAPRWTQDWFPRLDAAAAYALVRHHRPARIVEVGSGHSTRFLARAVADGSLDTAITAIDPAPRATLDGLSSAKPCSRPAPRRSRRWRRAICCSSTQAISLCPAAMWICCSIA